MIFLKKHLFIGLMLLAFILFLLPKFISYFDNELDMNLLRAMNGCLKDKQIPCRWIPVLDDSYGSPIFIFFAPLPYYLGGFILFMKKDPLAIVRLLFSMSLISSLFFIWILASYFLNRFKALLVSSLYMLLFFFITAQSEERLGIGWGLMIFPLTLLGLQLIFHKRNIRNFLFFSLSVALLILSSNLNFILIGLLCLIIGWLYFRFKSFSFLTICLFSLLFAFFLSAFYIFPALLERRLVHSVSPVSPLRFLPISAKERLEIAINSPYQILTGDSEVYDFRQGTNWMSFETNTKTHTIIRLSGYYFPDWKMFDNGKEIKFDYQNNTWGLMTIILGEGKHVIEARLFDTPIRLISNMVTIVTSFLILLLFIFQFSKVKQWISYYRKRMH